MSDLEFNCEYVELQTEYNFKKKYVIIFYDVYIYFNIIRNVV